MAAVFRAELICSDERCTAVFEAYGTLAELEALACDCGCMLVVVSVAETDATELSLEPIG